MKKNVLTVSSFLLLVLLLIVGLTPTAADNHDGNRSFLPVVIKPNNDLSFVRMLTKDYDQVRDAITPSSMVEYDTFVWLGLKADQLKILQDSPVAFIPQQDPFLLWLNQYRFDPEQGEPEIPEQLLTSYGAGEEGFYLLQFVGPTKDDWLAALSEAGAIVIQYQPQFAYIVRMTPEVAAEIEGMEFVRWVGIYHAAYRIDPQLTQPPGPESGILNQDQVIENVSATIYDDGQKGGSVDRALEEITGAGGELLSVEKIRADDPTVEALFALPQESVVPVGQLNGVLWQSFSLPEYPLEDEMSGQIIAGNFNAAGPVGPGYQAWLTSKGVDGTGVTVALLDSGYDTGVDATAHPDLSGRTIMINDLAANPPTEGGGGSGHGTHVGGIIAGNASLGTTDANNYLMGLGVAPNATLAVRSFAADSAAQQLTSVINAGAVGSNHSYALHNASTGYQPVDRNFDNFVRDADSTTAAVAEPLVIVFSAGNCGNGPFTATCNGNAGPTKEAKNIIAVANSLNQRDGNGNPNAANIQNINGSSSRGPAQDGRLYPHLAAPGTNIISTRSSQVPINLCAGAVTGAPAANPTYSLCTGTSMAAPHVTGSVALITEWWRTFNAGANPSPAMVKALLINGAVDLGVADIPNNNEGWGRINLDEVIVPSLPTLYWDQVTTFGASGQNWNISLGPADATQPLKISLVWSDAAGAGSGGATAAWVNDLDLTVTQGATTFFGNVFANGWSTTGGANDGQNNAENVYIQNPSGVYDISVSAANIAGDGVPYNGDVSDQDFALVCYNCSLGADLSIVKEDYPDPVLAGDKLWYDITVTNLGPNIATGVTVSDTLPLGVVYDTDTDSCVLSPGTGNNGEDQLTCDLGDIPVNDSRSFTIQVTVDADLLAAAGGPDTITNLADVFSTLPDLDLSNNSASATTIVNGQADLRVTKECKPDRPVAAGDEAVCTIWVENLGPSTAREVVAVDEHVSDGTFYIGETDPASCVVTPLPELDAKDGSATVTCNLGDIDPGDTVVIRVPEWSYEWIDLNDHVTVSSDTDDPDPSNNQDEDHVEVRPIADLAISKSAFPDPVVAGSLLTYTLTITNNGPSAAEDVRLEDVLPAGVTIITVDTSPAGVCAPGVPGTASEPTVCVFGNLADTDMATVTIVVMVHEDNPGPLHNSAQVFSDNHDPNMIDNFASTTTTVGDSADLSITKTDNPDPVNAGDELTYEVTITNHGPSDATDVALLDTLPPEVTFVGATISNGGGTCVLLVAPPNTVSCDLGTLSSGSFVTVFITVLVDPSTPDGTVISNTATVSSATGDPVPGNNTAVEQTMVLAESDVEILKDGSVDVTNPAPLVTYDITVINHGPSDALNVVFVDTLPLTPKKVVYTFDTGNGACAYDETAHTVTCDLGTVEAGESVEILIYVEIRGSVGVISNVVTVTTDTFDPDPANNTARKDLLIHG